MLFQFKLSGWITVYDRYGYTFAGSILHRSCTVLMLRKICSGQFPCLQLIYGSNCIPELYVISEEVTDPARMAVDDQSDLWIGYHKAVCCRCHCLRQYVSGGHAKQAGK